MKAYAYAADCFQKTVYGILEAASLEDAAEHLGEDAEIVAAEIPDILVCCADENVRVETAKRIIEEARSKR